MEERGFKVGDVVELKSGGPDMTVEDITDDGVACVWFVYASDDTWSNLPDRDVFEAGALCLITSVDEAD